MKQSTERDELRALTMEEIEHVSGGDQYDQWWQQILASRAIALATQIGKGQVQ